MAWCKTNVSEDFKPWEDFSLQTAFNMLVGSLFLRKWNRNPEKKFTI